MFPRSPDTLLPSPCHFLEQLEVLCAFTGVFSCAIQRPPCPEPIQNIHPSRSFRFWGKVRVAGARSVEWDGWEHAEVLLTEAVVPEAARDCADTVEDETICPFLSLNRTWEMFSSSEISLIVNRLFQQIISVIFLTWFLVIDVEGHYSLPPLHNTQPLTHYTWMHHKLILFIFYFNFLL